MVMIGGAAASTDPPLAAAFRAAFREDRKAILKDADAPQGVRYTPGQLVEAPFGPVLLSPGQVINAAHVSPGRFAVFYLRNTSEGFQVRKRFVPALQTGSGGKIDRWRVSHVFGLLPIVMIHGSGTWQGCSSSWIDFLELAPDKPRQLASLHMKYDDREAMFERGRPQRIAGSIAHIIPNHSFDVVYSGSKGFRERYVRRGHRYVLADPRKSRMPVC